MPPAAPTSPEGQLAPPPIALPLRIVGRSLLPIVALALVLGTFLWGPWVTLVLTLLWWRIVARIG